MKFMATWRVHDAKRHDALKTFSQMTTDDDRTDMGSHIKLIGRWHDLQRFTGVAIFETDDPEALASWILNWNGIIDIDVTPVLDDAEVRALGKKKFPQG
jgi:hypothetical protein